MEAGPQMQPPFPCPLGYTKMKWELMKPGVRGILLAAVCSCILTACPPEVHVTLYNDTPQCIRITWLDGELVNLVPHASTTLRFPPVLKRFQLNTGSSSLTYRIRYPEKDFMYPKYRYGLQIEPS